MDTVSAALVGQNLGIDNRLTEAVESPERLQEIAQEFEALIIHQLLRQLRVASHWGDEGEDELFGTRLLETIDVELARQIALDGGFGLAETLMPALAGKAPDLPATVAEAGPGRTGGSPTSAIAPHQASESLAAMGGEASSSVTSEFGWRHDPIAGDERLHTGVDLRAAYGREVGAAQAGRVVHAGEQGGYGLTVVIEHRPGIQTRYAHLSSVLVTPGERVEVRQPIGRAGQTGRATGPHVHFEVIRNGTPIDPARVRGGIDALLERLSLAADSANDRTQSGVAQE